VPCEASRRHHADPAVNSVIATGRLAPLKVLAQPNDLALGPRAEEHAQVDLRASVTGEVERAEPLCDLLQERQIEPRLQQYAAERVHVVAGCTSAKEPCLQEGGPPAHERVVHQVSRLGEARDEEPGQLGLEAGAIGHLVQGMAGPLG